jgi:hypothetical protein
MKNLERFIYLMLITSFIACADLSPKKNFTSTLYAIDWDTRCLTYVNNETNQTLTRCFVEYVQIDNKLIPIDDNGVYMTDIVGISTLDFQKELDFQNLQKKQCKTWESGSTNKD